VPLVNQVTVVNEDVHRTNPVKAPPSGESSSYNAPRRVPPPSLNTIVSEPATRLMFMVGPLLNVTFLIVSTFAVAPRGVPA